MLYFYKYMPQKNQINTAFQLEISKALEGENLPQFIFFYKQLEKLKSNRESFHVEFILKQCYPKLSNFSILEIEMHLNNLERT